MNHRSVLALVWVCVLLLVFASCSGSSPMPGASAEVDASVTTAPLDAKAQVRAAYVAARQAEGGRDAQYAVRAAPRGDGFVAVHEAMGMRAELGGNGATLSKAGETWSATLAGARYGCAGGSLAAIERTGAPRVGANPNRVEYAGRATGAAVDEWYVHGPLGLEQGFTVGQSACGGGGGDLVIEVRLEGLEAAASPGGSGLDLRDAGNVVRMRYTDLWARDASGAALVASMDAVPGWIALRVDARGAKFPVTVNPLAWLQTAELTASDGAANDRFGYSVSVSGPLAIVGATYHAVGANAHQGAAYVFVQSGTTWTQQQELTASDGAASDDFGTSVALSGTTAIVGAPDHAVGANPAQGAAYVFVQSGATWTQQQELTASDGVASDVFGSSVSLSGTMAIVGAQNHTVGASQQQGAAYIFAQSGTTWTQQQEVTASDGVASDDFGTSVSLSGTIAIVGAPYHTVGANQQQGAAYIFVQSGATWTQQQELTAGDGAGGDHFGLTGSVSGNIAIVGSFFHNRLSGAAYIFVQSGTTWTQQQELTASDGAPYAEFGFSVSLSGTTAIVGADDHTVGANPESRRGVRVRAIGHDVDPAAGGHGERRGGDRLFRLFRRPLGDHGHRWGVQPRGRRERRTGCGIHRGAAPCEREHVQLGHRLRQQLLRVKRLLQYRLRPLRRLLERHVHEPRSRQRGDARLHPSLRVQRLERRLPDELHRRLGLHRDGLLLREHVRPRACQQYLLHGGPPVHERQLLYRGNLLWKLGERHAVHGGRPV